jgi:hypothetical protein
VKTSRHKARAFSARCLLTIAMSLHACDDSERCFESVFTLSAHDGPYNMKCSYGARAHVEQADTRSAVVRCSCPMKDGG